MSTPWLGQLIEVHWCDSEPLDNGGHPWHDLEEIGEHLRNVGYCRSAGICVHEDDRLLVLANSVDDCDSPSSCLGPLIIPKAQVEDIYKLVRAGEAYEPGQAKGSSR